MKIQGTSEDITSWRNYVQVSRQV